MITVKQILRSKGHAAWTISPDASVLEALQLMEQKDIGALVVVEGKKLVGMFSERDYARKFIHGMGSTKDIQVRELMSAPVDTVRPGMSIGACMALMTERRFRHLPVVEGENLVGIISIGDVVKAIISEQQKVIDELGNFINGKR